MFYTFRYRTGPLSDIVEGTYTAVADNVYSAVAEFKRFIQTNYSSEPLVVSYFYLKETSSSVALGEFTESFYTKHFKDFQNV